MQHDEQLLFPLCCLQYANDDASHSLSYISTLPCHTLLDMNVPHVTLHSHDDIAIDMPWYEHFELPPIVACNMLNNCSFPCIACNNDACHVVTNSMNNCSFPMFVDNKDKTLNM